MCNLREKNFSIKMQQNALFFFKLAVLFSRKRIELRASFKNKIRKGLNVLQND